MSFLREGSPAGRALLLPLLVLALLAAVHAWTAGDQGMGIDFYQFWVVGQAVREGLVEDVYAPEAWPRLARIFMERARVDGGRRHLAAAAFRREEIQTSNTPFLYAAFYALESGDYETDIKRFRLLSLLLASGSLLALCRCAGWSVIGSLAALALGLHAFAPFHYDLREGNVNSIQLACLALFVLILRGRGAPWRDLLAGAVLGAGVAFKPNLLFVPLALVIAWAVQRRYGDLLRRGAGLAAGGLAAVAAGSLFFGSLHPWFAWLESISRVRDTFGSEMRWGSFGGARILMDLTGMNLSALLYLLALGAVGLFAWRAGRPEGDPGERPGLRRGIDIAVTGLGPLVPLLAADLAWPHYLVQTVPILIWLLRPAGVPAAARAGAALGLAGICSSPVVDWLSPGADLAYAVPLALGSLLLFVSGLAGLEARRRASPPEAP